MRFDSDSSYLEIVMTDEGIECTALHERSSCVFVVEGVQLIRNETRASSPRIIVFPTANRGRITLKKSLLSSDYEASVSFNIQKETKQIIFESDDQQETYFFEGTLLTPPSIKTVEKTSYRGEDGRSYLKTFSDGSFEAKLLINQHTSNLEAHNCVIFENDDRKTSSVKFVPFFSEGKIEILEKRSRIPIVKWRMLKGESGDLALFLTLFERRTAYYDQNEMAWYWLPLTRYGKAAKTWSVASKDSDGWQVLKPKIKTPKISSSTDDEHLLMAEGWRGDIVFKVSSPYNASVAFSLNGAVVTDLFIDENIHINRTLRTINVRPFAREGTLHILAEGGVIQSSYYWLIEDKKKCSLYKKVHEASKLGGRVHKYWIDTFPVLLSVENTDIESSNLTCSANFKCGGLDFIIKGQLATRIDGGIEFEYMMPQRILSGDFSNCVLVPIGLIEKQKDAPSGVSTDKNMRSQLVQKQIIYPFNAKGHFSLYSPNLDGAHTCEIIKWTPCKQSSNWAFKACLHESCSEFDSHSLSWIDVGLSGHSDEE